MQLCNASNTCIFDHRKVTIQRQVNNGAAKFYIKLDTRFWRTCAKEM